MMETYFLHFPRTYSGLSLEHGLLDCRSALLDTVFGHLLTTFSSFYVVLDIWTFSVLLRS